jgi:hypothetical protein
MGEVKEEPFEPELSEPKPQGFGREQSNLKKVNIVKTMQGSDHISTALSYPMETPSENLQVE